MKKLLCALLAVMLAVCCTSCRMNKEEEIKLIGVLQPNVLASQQLILKNEIEEAIKDIPNVKCIYADAGNNVSKQISDIYDMIARQVDVIIVSPCSEQLIETALKEAVEAGIYVIVLGYAPYDSSAYTLQLFVNNYKIGYVAGEYAVKALNGEGIILEVQDDPSMRTTQERKKGFLAAIAEHPGIVKEYVVAGYGSKDTASYALTTSEILDENVKIDFVFSHNNDMAQGIYAALITRGIDPIIVGVGCYENTADEFSDRGITASVMYVTLGTESIEYALQLMEGETFEKSVEFDPVLYTEDVNEW